MEPTRDEEVAPGHGPERGLRPAKYRPGRRRRRIRWTIGLLTAAALAAATWGILAYRASRPEIRRPGEALEEVTDRLARAVPTTAPVASFEDTTVAAGLGDFRTFAGTRTSQLPEDMGSGAAWGDFDGDGDDDLFLVAAGGPLDGPPEARAPSRLYENLGDGGFRVVAGFPDLRVLGMGAAWADVEGDGDLDLVVSGYRTLRLFRNEGGGTFVRDEGFAEPEGYWAGVAWADFDGDRDLDLYVCGYVRYEPPANGEGRTTQQYGAVVPYTLNPASFEPERNLLLVNRGDGTFDEAALEWGVANPSGRSLSALWHDFDDDGRLDLYVANDISDNAFFLNRGETFEDAGLAAWVADYRGAMGLAAGDWNRDGDDDLFVTHWLAQENALYDSRLRSAPPAPGTALQPLAGTGSPQITFSDLSAPLGLGPIALPLVGWGTEFVDLDADGRLDLVVANGSTVEQKANPELLQPQRSMILWNGGDAFHDLEAEVFSEPRVSRGLAFSDYDGDGRPDLLVVHLDGGVQLLRNRMGQGNWLALRLRQRLAGGGWGQGEGAVAVGWIGAVPLRRSVGGASYLSRSTATLHFGLGTAPGLDSLEVRWPGGVVEHYGPLDGNGIWEIREGETAPVRVGEGTAAGAAIAVPTDPRERVLAFWASHRAAMDAMKREEAPGKAIPLFRTALALDPDHEDARYYLANCLWAIGDGEAALSELAEMRRRAPGSLRAHLRYAALKATVDGSAEGVDEAVEAVERALDINQEETGGLLLLAELELMRGDREAADGHLAHAIQTNSRTTAGLFLRGYVAWRDGRDREARELLARARESLGPDWKPEGAVLEGDVKSRLHREGTPLAAFWTQWDGSTDPDAAYETLRRFLGA